MFADLADTASPFFSKRVKVLDTVAQLRCCVLMLEINCVGLVLEMFNVFFSVVRLKSMCTFSLPPPLLLLVLSCLAGFGLLRLLFNWEINLSDFVRFLEGLYMFSTNTSV